MHVEQAKQEFKEEVTASDKKPKGFKGAIINALLPIIFEWVWESLKAWMIKKGAMDEKTGELIF